MRVVSLFAGIGGFDLGAEQSGMKSVAHVEIDASCRKLLAARFPGSVVLDDVRTAGRSNLPDCDVVCGGFPCQDLSVAGARAGLAGARSGLFYELTRITHELQPAFLVWENVPGLLSSNKGHDFLAVLTELRRIGYHGGWRTLDAQYFGLAQRRRRVFGVFARRDIGAERCAEILSLSEGVRGHSAPGREAGKAIAGTLKGGAAGGNSHGKKSGSDRDGFLVAGTLGGSSQSGGFRTTDLDNNGAFVVGALSPSAHPGGFNGQDAYTGHLIAHTLRGEGFDASKDGTGRATPLVAFSCKDSGADAVELSPTLRSMNFADSHMNGGGQVAITTLAIRGRGDGRNLETREDGTSNAVLTPNGGRDGMGIGAVQVGSAVRRLTPRECERLQGFPNDWTAGFSDSTRYRMLGNAVAVPVARWLFARMALAGL